MIIKSEWKCYWGSLIYIREFKHILRLEHGVDRKAYQIVYEKNARKRSLTFIINSSLVIREWFWIKFCGLRNWFVCFANFVV